MIEDSFRRILISTCLLGLNCTYLGKPNESWNQGYHRLLEAGLTAGLEFFPACPEQLGGLPTPRPPAELQASAENILAGQGVVKTNHGQDVTACFLQGAREAHRIAQKMALKIAVLKSRSPSCGVGQIGSGKFDRRLIEGNGLTTCLFRQNGLVVIGSDEFLRLWLETGSFSFLNMKTLVPGQY